jgi:DNA-binding transcriptional ArsR family regulator
MIGLESGAALIHLNRPEEQCAAASASGEASAGGAGYAARYVIAGVRPMFSNAALAETAALVGEPARAAMLMALMDGRALTAAELARVAGIMPQTASGHLARMTTAGLLALHRQGRHHYHRLASPAVARMLEAVIEVCAVRDGEMKRRAVVTGPRDAAMRAARTCYDHLAGRLGVGLADALTGRGHVELSAEGGAATPAGLAFLREFGVEFGNGARHSVYCRPCLDWSERRLHIGGALGAALAARCFALGWIRRQEGSRAVTVTPAGERGFRQSFGM